MKSLKQIVVASLALGAVSAYADYAVTSVTSIGAGSPTVTAGVGVSAGTAFSYSDTYTIASPVSGVSEYQVTIGSISPSPGLYLNSSPGASSLNTLISPSSVDLAVNSVTAVAVTPGTLSEYSGTLPIGGSVSVTGAGTFDVFVDWTLASGSSGLYTLDFSEALYNFDRTGANNTGSSVPGPASSDDDETYLTSVPEPGQVIGGCMLLGCGALVFTGRRFMAKKA